MAITDWPLQDRPREKLLTQGATQLSDTELLAVLFRTGIQGQSAVDLARTTLKNYSGLRQLLDAEATSFCELPGMGLAKYALLQAALELGRRYLAENLTNKDIISDSADCIAYLSHRLRHRDNEVFACLFLNSKHHVITYLELFEGTVDNSHVYPREVVKQALKHNAAAVIFCHNHPSGDAEPSQTDIDLTKELATILAGIDVRVLDHIVVGRERTVSLKQRRLC